MLVSSEEAILTEEKTTELERRHIMESELSSRLRTSVIRAEANLGLRVDLSETKLCDEENETWC